MGKNNLSVIIILGLFVVGLLFFKPLFMKTTEVGYCKENVCGGVASSVDSDGCQHWIWETDRWTDRATTGYRWNLPSDQGKIEGCGNGAGGGWSTLANLIPGGLSTEFPTGEFSFSVVNRFNIVEHPIPPSTLACTQPSILSQWSNYKVRVKVECGGRNPDYIPPDLNITEGNDADLNSDGVIDRYELSAFALKWIGGTVTREALGLAAQAWINIGG